MNLSRICLTLLAAFPLAAAGAPVPAPPPASGGPVSELQRLRSLLPTSAPLRVLPAVAAKEGTIELEQAVMEAVEVTRTATRAVPVAREVVEKVAVKGGGFVERRRVVTETVYEQIAYRERVLRPSGRVQKVPLSIKSCKFFEVGKDGKLEALDSAKAAALLKNKTAILAGDSAEVDPRHLDLIKPGTLYLVLPPPAPAAPPPMPERRPDN